MSPCKMAGYWCRMFVAHVKSFLSPPAATGGFVSLRSNPFASACPSTTCLRRLRQSLTSFHHGVASVLDGWHVGCRNTLNEPQESATRNKHALSDPRNLNFVCGDQFI